MRRANLSRLVIVAVAAGLHWPAPLPAQCRLCATPTTTRETTGGEGDLTLEIESSLAFGRLVLSGEGRGTASLHPDGTATTDGAIAAATNRAMVGSITVRGEAGRAVRVELPRRIRLYSLGGAAIEVDQLFSDLSGHPKLDSAGKLTFRFGGRIAIDGEVDGEFRGELPITVEYL